VPCHRPNWQWTLPKQGLRIYQAVQAVNGKLTPAEAARQEAEVKKRGSEPGRLRDVPVG
jgi:hypothetical protein